MSKVCIEGGLPLVPFTDSGEMVRTLQVEFGENGGRRQRFKGRTHQWERVLIFDCDVVELTVVNAGPEGSVLLAHKEESCSNQR